jgi:hypothetical protein
MPVAWWISALLATRPSSQPPSPGSVRCQHHQRSDIRDSERVASLTVAQPTRNAPV